MSTKCNWLRRSDTQDPAIILERKEARTCKGCIHKGEIWNIPWCLKFEKTAEKKCTRYKEKE